MKEKCRKLLEGYGAVNARLRLAHYWNNQGEREAEGNSLDAIYNHLADIAELLDPESPPIRRKITQLETMIHSLGTNIPDIHSDDYEKRSEKYPLLMDQLLIQAVHDVVNCECGTTGRKQPDASQTAWAQYKKEAAMDPMIHVPTEPVPDKPAGWLDDPIVRRPRWPRAGFNFRPKDQMR